MTQCVHSAGNASHNTLLFVRGLGFNKGGTRDNQRLRGFTTHLLSFVPLEFPRKINVLTMMQDVVGFAR